MQAVDPSKVSFYRLVDATNILMFSKVYKLKLD